MPRRKDPARVQAHEDRIAARTTLFSDSDDIHGNLPDTSPELTEITTEDTGNMGEASVTASNWRLVETGRIAMFVKGPYTERLATIVQIIDHKRVLVEGPSSDASKAVPRHSAPLSSLSLTNIVIKLPLAIGHAGLKKKWDSEDVEGKFYNSSYAKGKAQFKRRKQLNDFERFKVMVLRKQERFELRKSLASSKAQKA